MSIRRTILDTLLVIWFMLESGQFFRVQLRLEQERLFWLLWMVGCIAVVLGLYVIELKFQNDHPNE